MTSLNIKFIEQLCRMGETMKNLKQYYPYIGIYFISYISFSFQSTNFTPFMSSIGYDAMERGVVLSGIAVVSLIIQFSVGILSDKLQTVKRIIVMGLISFAFISLFSFQEGISDFILQFIIISFSGGLINSLCGLYDTWLMGISDESRDALSFIKAFGSIGWAVGSILSSYTLLYFYNSGLRVTIVLLIIVSLYLMRGTKDVKKVDLTEVSDVVSNNALPQLFKNRRYLLLIGILILNYSLIVANSGVVIDKMLSLGASNVQISLKWSVGSLVEIPTFIIGSLLLKNIRSIRLLQLSIIVITLQFFLFTFATTSSQMIMITGLQLFTTPLVMIASKMLIYEITPRNLANSSQMIALSLFTGIPSLLIPLLAGTSSITFGINQTLLMLALLGVVAFVLSIYYVLYGVREN